MILVKEMPCGCALLPEFKIIIQYFNKVWGFFLVVGFGLEFYFFFSFIGKYVRFAVSLFPVEI